MGAAQLDRSVAQPPRALDGECRGHVLDLRFRAVIGEAAWSELPESVRRRFSKRVMPGERIVYRGRVVATELSGAGRVLAALARIIGGPLPLTNGATGAAAVTVSELADGRGQTWQRSYARPGRAPQIVSSTKCFSGPTGLEEQVGGGFGMALEVSPRDGALVFRSQHYFWSLGRWRMRLPRALSPGTMEIVHRDEPGLRAAGYGFSFRLTLDHPRLGRLLHQLAYFAEAEPG
jgi:hypothetical protein